MGLLRCWRWGELGGEMSWEGVCVCVCAWWRWWRWWWRWGVVLGVGRVKG